MILVTGGAGLIGKALIEHLLNKGEIVRAIYNKTYIPLQHQNLTQVPANILDIIALDAAMENIEQVYHCAAIVSFSPKEEQKLYKVNVEGTVNVVNAALAAGVKKLVHVSSVAALGRKREGAMINETMQWSPATSNSKYGHSKYLGEMEVWRGVAEGLDAVVVNPVIVLGAADWNESSTKIFKSVYDQFPWYTEGVTGFVDVRDVVTIMEQLMNSSINGERFILSGENATYHSLFDMIADAFGKRRPHKKVTPFLASLVWRVQAIKSKLTGGDPLLTKETADTAQTKSYFDNTKLLKALPQFTYRPLQQTITDTCAALQQIINKQ